MKALVQILFCILLVPSFGVADETPLLDQYLTQVTSSLWSPFQQKLSQLPNNFISELADLENGFSISYFSYESQNGCGTHSGTKTLVVQINYKLLHEQSNYIQEAIEYRGCRGKELFTETRTRIGKNLKAIGPKEVIFGEREFVLQDDEESLHIQWADKAGILFFHSIVEREDEEVRANLFSYNYELLGLFQFKDKDSNEERLAATLQEGYRINHNYNGRRIRSNWGGSGLFGFEVRRNQYGTKTFVSGTGSNSDMISENQFQTDYNNFVIPLFTYSAKSVIDITINEFFPETQLASSAPSANQEILDQLQLNLNRVRLGIEQQLLEQFFLEYIAGVEDGSIVIQKSN